MKLCRCRKFLILIIFAFIAACTTSPILAGLRSSGPYIAKLKKTTGGTVGIDPRGVSVGRNFLGQRFYTTVSVMSGTRPLNTTPDILVSDTDRYDIRLRFYATQATDELRTQTVKLAEKFITALADERQRKWPAEPAFTFTYNIYLIGWDESVDGQTSRVFHKNGLELSFYARALPIEKGDLHLADILAHETFHLMQKFYNNISKPDPVNISDLQKTVLEEVAANVFGQCIDLKVSEQLSLGRHPINTVTNTFDRNEVRKGSLNDHMLGRIIEPGFTMSENHALTIFGPMIFTTLWAEYAGQAETIRAGDSAAKKFMALCENAIWPPEKLIPVLKNMASDGVDLPQLRVKKKVLEKLPS